MYSWIDLAARYGRAEIPLFKAVGICLIGAGCSAGNDTTPSAATLVGRESCRDCHASEVAAFLQSDHDLAMDTATSDNVLARFDSTAIRHGDTEWRMYHRNGRFFASVRDADSVTELEVLYVFGYDPLQQYLVGLTGGRLQRVPASWDTRDLKDGGQRWFHVYEDSPPDPLLRWDGPSQNWNQMCADCHSTGLQKGYSLEQNSYATNWNEIDVSCEACHGPASQHLGWASSDTPREERNAGFQFALISSWEPADSANNDVVRTRSSSSDNACGACHSHRTRISEPGDILDFLNEFRPSLLRDPLYSASGIAQEEVFVWGSFNQSKMSQAGVTCSDCHDPHSLQLRRDGNELCLGCHSLERYSDHSRHDAGSPGDQCVNCHMPTRTFMQVDSRRDHRFGPVREVQETNTCATCHSARSPGWIQRSIQANWGAPEDHRSAVFAAAEGGDPRVLTQLIALGRDRALAGITRATAVSLLASYPFQETLDALSDLRSDPDPLVRSAATEAAAILPPDERFPLIQNLLSDTVKLVRTSAARALARVRAENLAPTEREALQRALNEYRDALIINADVPATMVELGDFYSATGDDRQAELQYTRAITAEPHLASSYLNLAEMKRELGDDDAVEETLRAALESNHEAAVLHFSLAMHYIRTGQTANAYEHLNIASRIDESDPTICQAQALALKDRDRLQEASALLSRCLARRPFDTGLLLTQISIHRERGALRDARDLANRLTEFYPGNSRYLSLLRQLSEGDS